MTEGITEHDDHWELTVHIKHPDGRVATHECSAWAKSDFPTIEDVVAAMHYQWTEGNYSCDCNRSLFFHFSVDGGPIDSGDRPCGDTYKVVHPSWIAE